MTRPCRVHRVPGRSSGSFREWPLRASRTFAAGEKLIPSGSFALKRGATHVSFRKRAAGGATMGVGVQDNYEVRRYGQIDVYWTPALDGGGLGLGRQFVPLVRNLFGKVGRLFEFCSGPGFIGFSLLAEGLCDHLCLGDINPEALEAAKRTVRENKLEDRVTLYRSDGLADIPETEKWDLVVANPPHFPRPAGRGVITDDPGWKLHRLFYENIAIHLLDGGNIIFQENYLSSSESDFLPFFEPGGLSLVDSFMYNNPDSPAFDPYYYMWSRKADPARIPAHEPVQTIEAPARGEPACAARAGVKSVIRVQNSARREVSATLYDERGRCLSRLVPVIRAPAGGEISAGPFILSEGTYFLRDLEGGTDILTINVR
jgi:hypothetical protein